MVEDFLPVCSFVITYFVSGGQRFWRVGEVSAVVDWKGPTDDQMLGRSLGHKTVSLIVGGLGFEI